MHISYDIREFNLILCKYCDWKNVAQYTPFVHTLCWICLNLRCTNYRMKCVVDKCHKCSRNKFPQVDYV